MSPKAHEKPSAENEVRLGSRGDGAADAVGVGADVVISGGRRLELDAPDEPSVSAAARSNASTRFSNASAKSEKPSSGDKGGNSGGGEAGPRRKGLEVRSAEVESESRAVVVVVVETG